MVNTITGTYDTKTWFGIVRVDGLVLDPAPSLKLRNHSPDGFAWGYSGSGPAQLALAILLAVGVPAPIAVAEYQNFKQAYIAGLPGDCFRLEVDVIGWLESKGWNPRIGIEGRA